MYGENDLQLLTTLMLREDHMCAYDNIYRVFLILMNFLLILIKFSVMETMQG
jgi:hypothetical protein